MKIMKLKKGFTLIELLIVIAIIAVLAVAFVPTLLGAPSKSRDTQRTTILAKISGFLQNQILSSVTLPVSGCLDPAAAVDLTSIGGLIKTNIADFSGNFPIDPKNDAVTTGAGTVCTGQYGYIKFDKTKVPNYSAVLYSPMENLDKANVNCKDIKDSAATPLTPGKAVVGVGEAACYAVLVQ